MLARRPFAHWVPIHPVRWDQQAVAEAVRHSQHGKWGRSAPGQRPPGDCWRRRLTGSWYSNCLAPMRLSALHTPDARQKALPGRPIAHLAEPAHIYQDATGHPGAQTAGPMPQPVSVAIQGFYLDTVLASEYSFHAQ